MFYYFRNTNTNPNVKRNMGNIVKIDKNKDILGYEENKKGYYISFGDYKGVYGLQFPVNMEKIQV